VPWFLVLTLPSCYIEEKYSLAVFEMCMIAAIAMFNAVNKPRDGVNGTVPLSVVGCILARYSDELGR
jgi:hypothetical protein